MFRGIFETTIDVKGRTSLPAKFRDVLVESYGDERFFITNAIPVKVEGGVSCSGLAIYPYREWLALETKIQAGAGLGFTSAQLDAVKRWSVAPAEERAADKLGRFLVPPHLRKSAALERDIVFVGSLKKLEIWNLTEWDKVFAQSAMAYPVDTQALAELGL